VKTAAERDKKKNTQTTGKEDRCDDEARGPGKTKGETISKGCKMSRIRLLRVLANGRKFDEILV
jgi:hypothetical protein